MNNPIEFSEEDLLEEENEEEGSCIGHYSARAKACKECLIVDECKKETSKNG